MMIPDPSSAAHLSGIHTQQSGAAKPAAGETGNVAEKKTATTTGAAANAQALSENDLKIVQQLKQRDSEVRAHEMAHLAAAGGIATSGAHFEYQLGPNGVRYAVGGEVNIDTSPVPGNPAATLRKADIIKSAALAPAQPSGQDFQVAAGATAMAARASAELLAQTQPAKQDDREPGSLLNVSA